jgi:hypothetical protein
MDRAYDKNLGDSIEGLARGSGALATGVEWATANPGSVAGLGGAALLARNYLKNRVTGGGGVAGALVGATGSGARVFVTNWPGTLGGGPGAGTVADGLAKAAGPASMAAAVGAPAALAGIGLGAVALHNKLLDMDLNKPMNKLAGDLAAGRKRRVKHWYNFGGASIEDVNDPAEQAKAAADYARLNGRSAPQEFKQTVNITVNGDQVDVNTDGTRKPEVKLKRGASR